MTKTKHTERDQILNAVLPLSLLDAHPQNYRGHPATQIERLRASLRKFGQPRSIVVQAVGERYTIVAGHGVKQAAEAEGWETLRCDVIPADWPAERVKAYLVADNQLGRLAEDDEAQLASLIEEARTFDAELLPAMGYSEAEFNELIAAVTIPALAEWEEAIGSLPDGDRSPFQQMTFTLSDDQAEIVKEAMATAKQAGAFIETGNENGNGNALARICEAYLGNG